MSILNTKYNKHNCGVCFWHLRPHRILRLRTGVGQMSVGSNTGCPTTYQTRQFFNNSKTNEDFATRFEQEYVRCVRNSYTMRQVRFKFRCNILISGKIIKELPGLVGSGTPCISGAAKSAVLEWIIKSLISDRLTDPESPTPRTKPKPGTSSGFEFAVS